MGSTPIKPNEYDFDFTDDRWVRWSRSGGAELQSPEHSTEHYVDDRRIAERFGRTLDPLLADWIDLALDIYLADRLALRHDSRLNGRAQNWARVITLRVPVRQLETWERTDVRQSLRRLLRFLTEDDWRIEFAPRTAAARPSESQGFLFSIPVSNPLRVALYSGGLDSFAGAAQELTGFPKHSFVFVSGATHTRQRAAQREQIGIISETRGGSIIHVVVPYGLRWRRMGKRQSEEPSQRTRGFLYLTLGAATAIHAGTQDLYVYENGLGAINLPYDGSQIGTSNSRAMHPVALFEMGEFIRILTGRVFHVENPFLFQTKAEMCRRPAVQSLAQHIHLTFSCDGFPVRAKNKPQCGCCTSCLLRRLSLESAGLSESDKNGYLNDLLSPAYRPRERQLQAIRAMEWQAYRIRKALQEEDPWRGLVKEFVELKRVELGMIRHYPESRIDLRKNLLRLYSQYAAEWSNFSARGHCFVPTQAA